MRNPRLKQTRSRTMPLTAALTAGVLGLAIAPAAVQACVTTPEPIFRELVNVTPGHPVKLKILDLLTVSLPGEVDEEWRVVEHQGDARLVRQLTLEQLGSALQSRRFVNSRAVVGDPPSSQMRAQLHFGAIAAGEGKLVLINESRKPPLTVTFNVTIAPRTIPSPPPRGTVSGPIPKC